MNKLNIILGASRNNREEHDFYATEPKATKVLLEHETFNHNILEPCCGYGDISKVLVSHGYHVESSDLVDRGYGIGGVNFLQRKDMFNGDIVTNPPYKLAEEFIYKAMQIINNGAKLAMFLKIQFLESMRRYKLFTQYPPKVVYVATKRLRTAKDGDFEKYKANALCYAWFVWQKGFKGEPTLRWCNYK